MARAVRALGSSPVLGALLALTAAPSFVLQPTVGLDPSWQAGMHLAARNGLDFGSAIDFTYGPLGFLAVPSLYYTSTGVVAVVFTLGLRMATCAAVLASARRSLGLGWALLCTYLAAQALRFVDLPQTIPVVLLLGCLFVLARDDRERMGWFPVVAGLVGVFLLLVKFNVGLVAIGLGAVTAPYTGRRGRRSLAVLTGVIVVSLLSGWLLTGNRVGDLPAWLSSSLHIASGYSTAMGLETDRGGDFVLLPLVTFAALLGLWLATAGWATTLRLSAFVGLAGVLFLAFKHGFVRHDGHVLSFFGIVPAVVLGLALPRARMLALFAVVTVAFVAANPYSNREILDPVPSLRSMATLAGEVTSVDEVRENISTSREAQRATYALDDVTLRALAGHTVHVDPWESSVAWAYPELEWRPLPVFQTYSAYTPELDERNAGALSSAHGPSRILRQTPRWLDGRNPDFDSPAAVRAMLCNYEEVSATDRWQVLARRSNRCGRPVPLGRVTARPGERIVVPRATGGAPALVVARVRGLEGSAAARAVAMLYKAPETYLEPVGGKPFRLVPATAGGPLLMSAPPELGYTPAFGFGRPISGFRLFQRQGVGVDRFDRVTVEFFRVPLRPFA